MVDKKLRKTIGERAKSRRKELGLTMDYVAERMDVNKSTIQRYESGTIDNSKNSLSRDSQPHFMSHLNG